MFYGNLDRKVRSLLRLFFFAFPLACFGSTFPVHLSQLLHSTLLAEAQIW